MKIHIVQKGDTLWKIAQKYGVDFNELKQVNTQLSNPDMIMPGMKIKIPTGSVPVKKQGNPYPKEEVSLSQLAPKEMPKQVSPAQMPPKEMPQPTPAPVAPKEMPQQIIPTPVVPKEMPVPQVIKETPIVLPPIPQMPVEETEIDYNIEQNMYNYTFNIPIKEAPVKEMPEVVAGVKEEPVAPPTMPAQPMPQAPEAFPCVPMTGLMPGSGLPCGFQPMPCPPCPCPPVAVPYGMQPMMQPVMQPVMQPAAYNPAAYPTQPTAVSPAVFDEDNDGSEQMYPGLSTTGAPVAPMAPGGQMTAAGGDCGCGGPQMDPPVYGGIPTAGYGVPAAGYGGMPAGYGVPAAGYGGMPAGYGGAPATGFGGMPPASYGGIPAVGYGGMSPASYGGIPPAVGYGGMSPASYGGIPAVGYGGMSPASYGGIPPAVGYGGMSPASYGGVPTAGYGGGPVGYSGVPTGFGAPQAGLPGVETQAPQGTLTPPEFPFGQFQTSFRDDDLDDEEDNW